MHKFVMEAVEETLKDWGIDWILRDREGSFDGLMSELELALEMVID